jgi:hypothetical protein
MTEATEVKAPAKKKAKVKKKATAPRAKADDKFAGMTVKDCCSGCNANACVISGKPYCAHPRKGGLHPTEMSDNGALNRRKEAENRLRDQLLSAR